MADTAQSVARRHRGLAAMLAALSAVGPFSIDAYLPSMPEIGRTFHASPLLVQQTLTAYMAPFALMALWHGAFSDALGRRRVTLAALALFFLASLGCALAWNIESLLFFRTMQGMMAGAGMVIGRAIVRDVLDGAEAQRLMSQITLTFAVAPAVAPVLGGWLHVWFGWRAVFAFLVLFTGIVWLVCWRSLPETLPRERRQPMNPGFLLHSYWRVLQSAPFVALTFAVTFNFAAVFLYIVSAPVFLIRHLHVSETGFLWLFGPSTLGIVTGAWLSGRGGRPHHPAADRGVGLWNHGHGGGGQSAPQPAPAAGAAVERAAHFRLFLRFGAGDAQPDADGARPVSGATRTRRLLPEFCADDRQRCRHGGGGAAGLGLDAHPRHGPGGDAGRGFGRLSPLPAHGGIPSGSG